MSVEAVYGQKAQKGLKKGVDQLANSVKVTLGARGRNVVYNNAYGATEASKDGVTIANHFQLPEGTVEAYGANLVRQSAKKSGDAVGDGTTTATVLTQALVSGGYKVITAGANPIDIKRGMDTALDLVLKHIAEGATPIDNNEKIKHVAAISANNDDSIGKLIADAVEKIGHSGSLTFEESKGSKTYIEVVSGMKLEAGYASGYFTTNQKGEAVLENPAILVYNSKINSMVDLAKVLTPLAEQKRDIFIVADDFDGEVLASLCMNKLQGNLRICVVKSPEIGEYRKEILDDLALVTGAALISESIGVAVRDIQPEHFGAAEKVIVSKNATIIIGGAGDDPKILERVQHLKEKYTELEAPSLKEDVNRRLGNLTGGVAVIHVGANTPVELKEKMDRVEDAVHATRAAIEEGIVAGGGVTLLRAAKALDKVKTENADQATGVKIVQDALQAPIRVILNNAGKEPAVIIDRILRSKTGLGYDVKADKYTNMIESGIIDPKKVTRVALESAVSVAGMILLTDCVLVEKTN